MTVANTSALSSPFANAGAQLQCQPYEEAVLRRAFVNGREVTDVTCITRMGVNAYAPQAAFAAQAPVAQPVYQTQPVYRDQVVTRPAARTTQVRRSTSSDARREDERSWGKTAMISGGSTGAGAGIGGLIGGKKGALIGAAVGGGAATIYEARKR
jgi:hypothetical protein